MSKSVGSLHKTSLRVQDKVFVYLYYSLVYPDLYSPAISFRAQARHPSALQTLQNKIVPIITKQPYLAHPDPLSHSAAIVVRKGIARIPLALQAAKIQYFEGFLPINHNNLTKQRQLHANLSAPAAHSALCSCRPEGEEYPTFLS